MTNGALRGPVLPSTHRGFMNKQPIQAVEHRDDGSLDVHSIFYTIQGEGPLSGHPAVFVRLAGCNLQCAQCDTVYTGPEVKRYSAEGLYAAVASMFPETFRSERLIVITGGEPFRQAIGLFTAFCEDGGLAVQIETNGTLARPFGLAASSRVVISPKSNTVHPSIARDAYAYKYPVSCDDVSDDGLPFNSVNTQRKSHRRVARPPAGFPTGAIYITPVETTQPLFDMFNEKACTESSLQFGYTRQIQLHKLMGVK